MAAQLNIPAGGAAPDAALAPAPQVHPLPIAVYRIGGFGADARAVPATSSVVKATEKIFVSEKTVLSLRWPNAKFAIFRTRTLTGRV